MYVPCSYRRHSMRCFLLQIAQMNLKLSRSGGFNVCMATGGPKVSLTPKMATALKCREGGGKGWWVSGQVPVKKTLQESVQAFVTELQSNPFIEGSDRDEAAVTGTVQVAKLLLNSLEGLPDGFDEQRAQLEVMLTELGKDEEQGGVEDGHLPAADG